jgi:hypothetical protein
MFAAAAEYARSSRIGLAARGIAAGLSVAAVGGESQPAFDAAGRSR